MKAPLQKSLFYLCMWRAGLPPYFALSLENDKDSSPCLPIRLGAAFNFGSHSVRLSVVFFLIKWQEAEELVTIVTIY